MDNMTKRQRSATMSKIRSKNTSPEFKLRSSLFRLGYRYRTNVRNLPGCPDIVMKKYNTIIFINGCFWHQHKECSKSVVPHSNVLYWRKKLKNNVYRDRVNARKLKDRGWKILTRRECEINKNLATTLAKVTQFLVTSDEDYNTVN